MAKVLRSDRRISFSTNFSYFITDNSILYFKAFVNKKNICMRILGIMLRFDIFGGMCYNTVTLVSHFKYRAVYSQNIRK